ncbi:retrotransposon protein, putative, ty1-copia subclass [Tanacetum coccineum]
MLMTMDLDIQRNLEHLGSYDMLQELKLSLLNSHPVSLNLAVSLILVSLSKEYDSFVQNYNMHIMGKTMNELHVLLKLHVQMLPKKDDVLALHVIRAGKMGYAPVPAPYFAPKPKNPPPPKKDNPAKDTICHQCCEVSHWRRNYPVYLVGLLKKKKLSQGASTSGFMESKKLKPRALSLYVGDGHRATVEAIGEFHLCLPTGCYIIAYRTPPHTPQHNGVSERRNRTLLDMVRSMMSQTTLPKSFWDYALESAARILNMVPTKKVEKTPYEVWHEQAPKLSYLKVWGCEALVKRDILTKPDKLEPKAFKCIFVGYPKETMGYSFYYPPENKVFVARNAKFFENEVIDHEASGSLEDLEIIQEEDTHPSLETSLNHDKDDQEIYEPQSDINPIRRSTRTRRAPDRMCLYIDAEEHELGDLGEPANYKAALLDPESDKWINAMNVEMQSMKDNEVWKLVELPPDAKTVGHKWIFKKKADMDGAVHTYKARLVAKGFTQTPGIDYEETFSHVADIRAIRILIAIVAFYDYEIWQMDVKPAFLNGYLNEEVYMEQPEGFVSQKYPNREKLHIFLESRSTEIDSQHYLVLCQASYIEKILKRFYMDNYKRGTIPMQEKLKFSKSQGASTPAEIQRMQNIPYASAIGSIMYVVRCTRPDVAFAQNITSRFQQNPSDAAH